MTVGLDRIRRTRGRRGLSLGLVALCAALVLQGCASSQDGRGGATGAGPGGQDEALYQALAQMAQTSEANNKYDLAVDQYRRLVEASPEEPAYILGLARNLRYLGRPQEAVRTLRRAIVEDRLDETLDARLELARALMAVGASVDASNQVADLMNSAPGDPRVLALVGILADREGRHAEAQAAYRAAMAADPSDLRSANNLALSLALTGDLTQAIQVQTEVASDSRATLPMRQNLALLYAVAGRMDMAERVTRAILPQAQADRVVADLARLQGRGSIPAPSLQP
ncbi:tetratricopeptide repeat protein [Roseospira navarrensis]|uniref:Tetratricopeptide repeat protein n=1 Tax=Roseospira navarrensis TaxID=140058 RepID=A0A7X1ZEW4_9PROT|nr:tetratricopeptide repeat protein [Roseospira navarrensis]MQX37304.1 tetratricopeptide repeat protein [Roseospira navarrensis]